MVINADWYYWSHRRSLAKALQAAGYEVTVATAVERGYQQAIEADGVRFVPLRLRRRSTAIRKEVASVFELYRLYRREKPDLVHHITIKPVLYGSLAARAAGVPAIVNTIPGLGYMFVGSGLPAAIRRRVASAAYRVALSGRRTRVILQNPDDFALFTGKKLVAPERATLIRGSGVDVRRFVPSPTPPGVPIVLLAARLLWDKGVGDLVQAARLLKASHAQCRVVLVGAPDQENPNSVSTTDLERWQAEGVVEWWGIRNDMPEVLRSASIVVLPSYYREGVPKILLEAAAAGRPIVTTDMPGCREAVHNGENGLLVPPHSPQDLASAIRTLLQDPELRARMGTRSRIIAETEFSEDRVLRETLAVYRELLEGPYLDEE